MDTIRQTIYDFFELPFHQRMKLAKILEVFSEEDTNLTYLEATQKWVKEIQNRNLIDKLIVNMVYKPRLQTHKQILIDKYIQRIKIDYPEDDKLMIDLLQFADEILKLNKPTYF